MRILIVDDSAFARGRIARVLTAAGHEAIQATGGQHALRLIAETLPDAVTVDLLMPEMDGLDLITRLHAAHPSLPLIVVSADIQEATQREVLAAGAYAFVSKAGRIAVLLDLLAELPGASAETFVLTLLQQDAFTELINQAMGQAANALASLLERRVILTVPQTEIMPIAALTEFLERRMSAVDANIRQRFLGPINGDAVLLFPTGHAEILVQLVLENTELPGFSEIERTVLAEIGNVVLNATISRLGDQLGVRLNIGLPVVNTHLALPALVTMLRVAHGGADHAIVLLSRLTVGQVRLVAYLVILLPEADIRRLLASLGL
jgi:CheY-like chemotaxis protein